jgi:hypothetical protein
VSLRTVLIALGAIVAFFSAVGLVLYFKPGGDDVPANQPALAIFAAGPQRDLPNGSATYFQNEHFYLVRQPDGAFEALYDLSPNVQALVNQGDTAKLSCRLRVVDLTTGEASTGSTKTFANDGLQDPCSGTVWDMTGTVVQGEAVSDLDRFPVEIIDDIVRVDLAARRCLNPVSDTAPCISTR